MNHKLFSIPALALCLLLLAGCSSGQSHQLSTHSSNVTTSITASGKEPSSALESSSVNIEPQQPVSKQPEEIENPPQEGSEPKTSSPYEAEAFTHLPTTNKPQKGGSNETASTSSVPVSSGQEDPPKPVSSTQPQTTSSVSKSPYDYPFDIPKMKEDLIRYGNSLGMTHREYFLNGEKCTPDNTSWELPMKIGEDFQGEALKKNLYETIKFWADQGVKRYTLYFEKLDASYGFVLLR